MQGHTIVLDTTDTTYYTHASNPDTLREKRMTKKEKKKEKKNKENKYFATSASLCCHLPRVYQLKSEQAGETKEWKKQKERA